MVPIHNNCDPQRPEGILKAIGKYAHAHSQLPQSLAEGLLHQREQRETKSIGKTTEAAREAFEGLSIIKN